MYTSFSGCYTSGVNSFACVGTIVVNSDFADLKGAATSNASDLDMAVTLQQLDKSIKVIKLPGTFVLNHLGPILRLFSLNREIDPTLGTYL